MKGSTRGDGTRAPSYDGNLMALGLEGEACAAHFLALAAAAGRDIVEFQDMRPHKQYFMYDVDFTCMLPSGCPILVEVKTDKHLGVTDNVLLEWSRFRALAAPRDALYTGWCFRSVADVLMYYAISVHKFYFARLPLLAERAQAWVLQRLPDKPQVVECIFPAQWTTCTDNTRITYNYLIPFKVLQDLFVVCPESDYGAMPFQRLGLHITPYAIPRSGGNMPSVIPMSETGAFCERCRKEWCLDPIPAGTDRLVVYSRVSRTSWCYTLDVERQCWVLRELTGSLAGVPA